MANPERLTHISTDLKTGFRLSPMEAGSAKYGPCEVCKKNVDSHYLQTVFRRFDHDDLDDTPEPYGWAYVSGTFGHAECHEKSRGECLPVTRVLP